MLEIESKCLGAELTSIKHCNQEKLFQGKSILDRNGNPYWARQAPVLFPIVGQVKNNKTIINGETYEMTQHGFARDMQFKQLIKNKTEHKYVLKSNNETLKKFPFECELYITYKVTDNILETIYEVINESKKEMIFGIGAHPAFICDYSTGEYQLEFEKDENEVEFLQLENGLLSNTKGKNLMKNGNIIELKKEIFYNDAIIMKNLQSNKVKLKNIKTTREVLEFDFTGFPYLAIWSKKGAPFVCIEPWFNTTDKVDSNGQFAEKENIIKLQANAKFKCNFKVEFK